MNRFRIPALMGLALVCACAAVVAFALLDPPSCGKERRDPALNPAASAEPELEQAVYVARGVVRGENPGSVTITLQGQAFDMTLSADDGSFYFEGLEAGSYTVTAARAGSAFSRDSVEVSVPSQAAGSLSFELVPPHPAPQADPQKPVMPASWWGYWLYARLPTSFYAYAYPAPPPPAPFPFPGIEHGNGADSRPVRGDPVVSARLREKAAASLVNAISDPDARVRAESALALGRIGVGGRPVMEALATARKDANAEVRSCAALSIGLLGGPEHADDLLRAAADNGSGQMERCHAAVAAGLCGGEERAIGLTNIASGNNTDVLKAAALIGAAATGSPKATFSMLTALLSNNSPNLQAAAACCVASHPERTVTSGTGKRARSFDLGDLLSKRALSKDTATLVRRTVPLAAAQFAASGNDIRMLVQVLLLEIDQGVAANASVAIGAAAARLGGADPGRVEAFEALKRFSAGSMNADSRACAVFGIGLCGTDGAGEHLLDIFESGDHPDVRAAAAAGLGILRHAPAVPRLCDEVARPRSGGDARGMSLLALGMIGDEASLTFLRTVLTVTNIPYLRWWAAVGLGHARDSRGFGILAGMTSARNWITRDGALRAIALYRDDVAVVALLDRFEKEGTPEIRALIVRLLGECARGPDKRLARIAAAFSPDALFALGEAGMLLYLRR